MCPICCSRPGGKADYKSINIIGHFVYRHGADYPGYQVKYEDKFVARHYCPDSK